MPEPVMVFCAAAPEDAHSLIQWETHLLPLQQTGHILLWSALRIFGGANRQAEIQQHLTQADIIVLLLSADFFASNECNAIMKWALQRTYNGLAHLVPLLLRPVTWQETELGAFACLPTNMRPVVLWDHPDEAFHQCVLSIKRLLDQPAVSPPVRNQQPRNTSPVQRTQSPSVAYHSCFLSYAHQDEPLAQRLYADLQSRGVQCWSASHNMKIGAKIRPTIDQAIQRQEKILILLSEHALNSTWIEDEVEAALEYEQREEREMIFPVRLDNSIMQTTQSWAAKLRRQVNIGDFTRWAEPQAYQQAFERLLGDLEKDDE